MKILSLGLIFIFLLTTQIAKADQRSNQKQIKEQIQKLQQDSEAQQILIQQLQQQQAEKTNAKALSPAPTQSISPDTVLGGYAEISYNGYLSDVSRNQMDLKRFVLSVGHRFSDKLSFTSEVEWEHAVVSATDRGETEIEQAFLSYDLNSNIKLRTGLFLMPFGFLNEFHEPPVFYGVERNEVETRIIPSTWREGGISVSGNEDSRIDWQVGIVTGFNFAKFDDASNPLRATHQELQLAKARDLSYYLSLNYQIPGFLLGSSIFTGDSNQGNSDFKADSTKPDFSGLRGTITLWDLQSRWQTLGFDFQILYARGTLADADKIDQVIQNYNLSHPITKTFLPSEFYGWYIQAAYPINISTESTLSPFVRLEDYNTQSKLPAGLVADPQNADRVATAGFSLKPHPQVVFKIDYQSFRDNSTNNRFNLGTGCLF